MGNDHGFRWALGKQPAAQAKRKNTCALTKLAIPVLNSQGESDCLKKRMYIAVLGNNNVIVYCLCQVVLCVQLVDWCKTYKSSLCNK